MTSETRVCSASKLHDEILWYIFRFNSYAIDLSDEDGFWDIFAFFWHTRRQPNPPLVTNRRMSQVCRQWRRVMVHSGSLWANAIDMQYLDQRGDDWRREVLIRTGEAPLTVIGNIGDPDDELTNASNSDEDDSMSTFARPFVFHLLEDHWERIQTLIIFSRSSTVDEKLCNALKRPAPNLMKFVVVLKRNHVIDNIIPFMNQAPNLHALHTYHLAFNLSGPSWSSTIRTLDLLWPKRRISITELLHSLECMTNLENLRLSDIIFDANMDEIQQIYTGHPMVKFLALRSFEILDSDSAVPNLLPHIIIPPQCTFYVNSTYYDFGSEEQTTLVYSTFFKNNFAQPTVTHVTYSISKDEPWDDNFEMYSLQISFGSGPTKSGQRQSRFDYATNLDGVSSTVFRMAEALLACDLSNVTTLSLSLNVHRPESILEHPLFESMYDFLLSFESVERLDTDAETLQFYMGSEDLCVSNVLFPRLETLCIDVWNSAVPQFVDYRRENSGSPCEGTCVKPIKQVFVTDKNSPIPQDHSSQIVIRLGWDGHDR